MANTLWVQAVPGDRKVIVSEYDESHPGNHEAWIVAYEDPRFDADGNPVEPANAPVEVGDTPLIRQRIAEKVLQEVSSPAQLARAEKERQATERAEQERLNEERIAAEKAAKGAK
jgi:hypothetical protein